MANERGFMLLSAIFLTLIVSLMATMLMTANVKVQQRNSTLYFTAINLANEQFALLESSVLENTTPDEIPLEDRITYNGDSAPIEFKVSTIQNADDKFTVKVEWTVDGATKILESTKTIRSITENPN